MKSNDLILGGALVISLCSCATSHLNPELKALGFKFNNTFQIDLENPTPDGTVATTYGEVDGHRVNFIFDTGSPTITVKNDSFFEKYPSSENFIIGGIDSLGTNSAIKVKSIRLGNITFTDGTILRKPTDDDPHGGTFGLGSFFNSVFVLDFYSSDQALFSNEDKFPEAIQSYPMEVWEDHIVLNGELNTQAVRVLFDTGCPITVVTAKIVEKYPKSFSFLGYSYFVDTNGVSQRSENYVLHLLRIGRLVLKDIRVSTMKGLFADMPGAPPIILGTKSMNKLRWIFDMKNHVWTVLN